MRSVGLTSFTPRFAAILLHNFNDQRNDRFIIGKGIRRTTEGREPDFFLSVQNRFHNLGFRKSHVEHSTGPVTIPVESR